MTGAFSLCKWSVLGLANPFSKVIYKIFFRLVPVMMDEALNYLEKRQVPHFSRCHVSSENHSGSPAADPQARRTVGVIAQPCSRAPRVTQPAAGCQQAGSARNTPPQQQTDQKAGVPLMSSPPAFNSLLLGDIIDYMPVNVCRLTSVMSLKLGVCVCI